MARIFKSHLTFDFAGLSGVNLSRSPDESRPNTPASGNNPSLADTADPAHAASASDRAETISVQASDCVTHFARQLEQDIANVEEKIDGIISHASQKGLLIHTICYCFCV